MKKLFIIGLLGLICLTDNIWGQSALLSADTIVMGDTTVLTVSGVGNGRWNVESSEYIEVLKEETNQGERHFMLTSYDPGVRYIKLGPSDSLQLVVLGIDIDPRSDEPKGLAMVPDTQSPDEDVVDIDEDQQKDESHCLALLWILAAAVVAGAILWFWWQKRKGVSPTNNERAIARDDRTAEERALQRLEKLKSNQLWQSGRIKEYYTELTDTLRVFIEETTSIRATEMTSEECLEALSQSRNNTITQLRNIFRTADLVKFAKDEPSEEAHENTMNKAVAFVKQMSRKEAENDA